MSCRWPRLTVLFTVFVQGNSFSTSGVGDAHAAARAAEGGSSLHAKSASATFPYTYPAASTLQLVSAVTNDDSLGRHKAVRRTTTLLVLMRLVDRTSRQSRGWS